MPESFDALACDLARFQADFIPGYARLCRARGFDSWAFARAIDAPAVPTDVFKLTHVCAFEPSRVTRTFRTSGTTIGTRGQHPFRDVGTYDAAALAFGRWALTADVKGPLEVLVVGPDPDEAPDSSLTHMNALFAETFGAPKLREETFVLCDGLFDLVTLDARISRAMVTETPVLLLGTSFAFVHLLDAMGEDTLALPLGSRVMQTGGFKGKSREVDGPTLRREIARLFSIPESHVVSEYGIRILAH